MSKIIASGTNSSLSVTATSQQLVGEKRNRAGLEISNIGSNEVYLHFGNGPAVKETGICVVAGGSYSLPTNIKYIGAVYAVCDTGETTTLSYTEF